MKCKCCGEEDADVGTMDHPECHLEFNRRIRDDECVRCGRDNHALGSWCDSCNISSPYKGYLSEGFG